MDKFIVATECAIEHQGKFLIIKRPQGTHAEGLLSFPGGKVEVSDNILGNDVVKQAIKREVFEEVGLNLLDPINYVTTSCFTDDKNGSWVIDIIYHCKLDITPVTINASAREVPEYYWLTYDEIVNAANCPEWLVKYMNKICKSI